MTNIEKRKPDTIDDISKSDLVQLSRELLDAIVHSTNILDVEEMTPKKLAEAKAVLGFVNATNNVMKTKMQFFKMVGMDEKIQAIKQKSENL